MKKLLVIFFLLSLLFSTATVYANSDISVKFTSFYNHLKFKSVTSFASMVVSEATKLEIITKEHRSTLDVEAASEIGSFYLAVNRQALENIKNYQKSYQAQLNEAQHTLEREMNFNEYAKNTRATLEVDLENDVEAVFAEVLGQ